MKTLIPPPDLSPLILFSSPMVIYCIIASLFTVIRVMCDFVARISSDDDCHRDGPVAVIYTPRLALQLCVRSFWVCLCVRVFVCVKIMKNHAGANGGDVSDAEDGE